MLGFWKAATVAAAFVAMVVAHIATTPRHTTPAANLSTPGVTSEFKLKWQTSFTQAAPLGSFSGCDNNAGTATMSPDVYCSGLPASLQSQWWAYPSGWPDTAVSGQLGNFAVGGYYDPAHTVWISGGQMHIRMFRDTSTIHSATVIPKASIGMTYGEFTETFRVSKVAAGYKSAHLLRPGNSPYEVDFPEGSWDKTICAYDHHPDGTQDSFCPAGATWTSWHTTTIVWVPGSVSFYLDGKLIGRSSTSPDVQTPFIIQNESSTDGESAAPNTSAQMDISHVAVYSYVP